MISCLHLLWKRLHRSRTDRSAHRLESCFQRSWHTRSCTYCKWHEPLRKRWQDWRTRRQRTSGLRQARSAVLDLESADSELMFSTSSHCWSRSSSFLVCLATHRSCVSWMYAWVYFSWYCISPSHLSDRKWLILFCFRAPMCASLDRTIGYDTGGRKHWQCFLSCLAWGVRPKWCHTRVQRCEMICLAVCLRLILVVEARLIHCL